MVFGIADDFDAPAAFDDGVALRNTLRRVVGAFGVNVRADFADQSAYVGLGKNDDSVDIGQRRHNLGALIGGHERAAIALEFADGIVGVDGDDKFSAELFRGAQITYVADVKKIEAAVAEGNFFALRAPGLDLCFQFFACESFARSLFPSGHLCAAHESF
jgi:hypothetical protein